MMPSLQQQLSCLTFSLFLISSLFFITTHARSADVKRREPVQWLPDDPPPVLENMIGAVFEQEDVPRFPMPAPNGSLEVIGTRTLELAPRQMEPPEYEMTLGPAFPMSNCIFCRPDGTIRDPQDFHAILDYMTPDMFRSYIKGSRDVLRNRCVFYTKAVPNFGGSLSRPATTWACSSRLRPHYSIWHLFPNSYDARTNGGVRDFYCLWNDGDHWLAPLRDAANRFQAAGRVGASPAHNYFQAMSQAMAESCSGRIIIFSWTPTQLVEYRPGGLYERYNNIFWSHERPVLTQHVRENNAELFVVDAANPSGGVRRITNTRTFATGPLEPYSNHWTRDVDDDLWSLNDTFAEIEKRDLCIISGVDSEVGPHDYFNDADVRAHIG